MKAVLSAVLFIFCATTPIKADTWVFKEEKKEHAYTFGAAQITLETDTTENQQYPEYTLTIRADTKVFAIYKGIAFEHIFADKDNNTFVGLSNSGLQGAAVVIFSASGRLLRLIK